MALLTVVLCLIFILSHLLCSIALADSWAPHESGTSSHLYGAWGDSASNVFACGDNGTILHFDGSQWSRLSPGVGNVLYGIWGNSTTDLFVVGNAGSIVHYDGTGWSQMNSGTKNHLNAIWGAATDSVYSAGSKGAILRYDGVSWSGMATTVSNTLYGLWGASSTDVFAVGNGGTVLRLQEDAWSKMSSGTTTNLWGIWGSSESDIYAVGNGGCILHYNGFDWTQMTSGTVENLYCVWGGSSNEVFAAGANGTILQFDGNTWTPMTTITNYSLRSLWGNNATDVFAVGDSGTILHYAEMVPVVTSISPNQGNQGDSLTATVTGNNFTDAGEISFGEGISVGGFSIDSPTQITANVTIAAEAVTGPRDVFVANPYGTGVLAGGFVVQSVNTPPVAGDDSYVTDEDQPLNVATPGILSNDTDGDGDGLAAALVVAPINGDLTLSPDGSFVYTPHPNFCGIDSFTYQAFDGTAYSGNSTVTITVNPVNDAPVAVADSYSIDEDGVLSVPTPGVLANDTDVEGDALSATLVSDVSHGTLTLSSDGSLAYTPHPDFHGTDSFTYQAFDGIEYSGPSTVSMNVLPINDAPAAANDTYNVNEDATLSIADPGVLNNDTDVDGNMLSAALLSDVSHGTLTLGNDGSFAYTPHPDFHGTDSFSYRSYDGEAYSNVAMVTVTVNPVNDAPVARDVSYVTTAASTLEIPCPGVLGNDSDVDGDSLTAVLANNVSHGTLTLNPDGSLTYTPEVGYSGTDLFSYRASDSLLLSNTATVILTVNWFNTAPAAVDDVYTTDEDIVLSASLPGVLGNDVDPDGNALTAILVNGPSSGSLILNRDGSFTYAPEADFHGTDSFFYLATDGVAQSEPATVSITVKPVNDAPRAFADALVVTEDSTLNVDLPGVLTNDSDVDSDSLEAILVSPPGRGTLVLNGDGSLTYTPEADFVGMDSFTYRAFDGSLHSNTVDVTIQVNQAPPLLLAVQPSGGLAGETIRITASGANFRGATALSLGPGIDIVDFRTESDDLMTAEILIQTGAAGGVRDITLVTPAGVARLPGAFEVGLAQPTISGVEPFSAPRGRTLYVSVFGNNFLGISSISFGQSILVNSYEVIDLQKITVSISIASEALIGPRPVKVFTFGGSATLPDGFEVTAAAPVVTSLSADSGQRGGTLEVIINGENLDQATEVNLGDGVTVESFYLDGSTRIVAAVRIADDASTGPRDVSVNTPQGSATLPEGFNVEWTLDPSSIWLWLGIGLLTVMVALFLLLTRRRQTKKWSLLDLSHRR